MNIEEDDFRDAIMKTGNWLAHFHVGETNRRPPGRGKIPWREVFGALQEIGYEGPIVMEPFITSDGDALREMWIYRDLLTGGTLDEEASRSVQFVRSELKIFA